MKIKAKALSNSTPKEWVLLPTIVITSESPFYIIISWLRWYIEFDFFPTYKSKQPMKQRKSIKVSKEKAIIIASNHNNIPIQKAKAYTDSELRKVLRHLNLKPGF